MIGSEKRMLAVLLAFCLGALGAHKFYLGYAGSGALMLLASTVGLILVVPALVMAVIAIYEGLSYLHKSDLDFVETYVYESKPWF
ncbi:MAG TPA: TM2 domain-containing protein [Gammaproteobacteria bacterium]